MNQTLLEIRNSLKERKPEFIRQDNPKRMKLNYKWRKPKGIHSKIRHHFKGRRKMPSPGFRSPVEVRGTHYSGLEIVIVASINDVAKIKNESEGIVVSKQVGMRKKLEILKRAKELKIAVLNLNADEHIKKIEDFVISKKKKEAKPRKETPKEKESKPKEQQELTDEQKKEADKKERDKLLTKRA